MSIWMIECVFRAGSMEDAPKPGCEADGFLDGEHAEKRVALLDVRCEVSHVNGFIAIHHDLDMSS